MEADDFSAMPSAAQARGFLRSYAEYLGLDADGLIASQRSEFAAPPAGIDQVLSPQEAAIEASAPAAEDPVPEPAPAIPEPEPAPTPEPPEPEPEPLPPGPEPRENRAPVPSELIFFEIGQELCRRREMLSLTLDEIERHTRVRKHYLEKIEAGDYEALPSPVQARGMLSNYASFLDMNTEAILLRFADGLQARRLERQPGHSARPARRRAAWAAPTWLGRFLSPDLLFGGGMILLLFVLTVWGAQRVFSSGGIGGATQTTGPSISDVLLATPVATTALNDTLPTSVAVVFPTSVGTQDLTPTDTPPAGAASNVQVTISVLERTFLRVIVDGVIKEDGRVVPGAAYSYQGQQRIEVLTGSGSGIHLVYNQADLGTLGNFGEVVDRIYTVNGIQTPTATSSPTVTATARFQKTPSATPTPTRTPTAKP
jgi:cytoskeleton protein RodZ